MFPQDQLLSRQHVQFYVRNDEMVIEDLGSSNGTLLRIRGPVPLDRGSDGRGRPHPGPERPRGI